MTCRDAPKAAPHLRWEAHNGSATINDWRALAEWVEDLRAAHLECKAAAESR